jgi:hypothetical protein
MAAGARRPRGKCQARYGQRVRTAATSLGAGKRDPLPNHAFPPSRVCGLQTETYTFELAEEEFEFLAESIGSWRVPPRTSSTTGGDHRPENQYAPTPTTGRRPSVRSRNTVRPFCVA